jgi:enoyl-CoA hydratase/carnithine racemase
MQAALLALRRVPKPVVCRLNGHVRAGGIGLVAACDVVLAPDDATFAFSEVRFALVPAFVSVVARRVMTPRALEELVLSGRVFDAHEATAAGLVTRTVMRADLDDEVSRVAGEFSACDADAVARAKALLADLGRRDEASGLAMVHAMSVAQFRAPNACAAIERFTAATGP